MALILTSGLYLLLHLVEVVGDKWFVLALEGVSVVDSSCLLTWRCWPLYLLLRRIVELIGTVIVVFEVI